MDQNTKIFISVKESGKEEAQALYTSNFMG
jgi:hypothetical protein